MADTGDTGPLTWNVPVVDVKTGRPTPEFQRKWEQQRRNNALIAAISFGTGGPTGVPADGAQYIDTSVTPYVFYVGSNGNWHQVSARVFLDLADVPVAYIADALVQVNAAGTALEFNALSTYTANPTAVAKDTAVNGSASTFMRSDASPAVQLASSSQFGIVKVDGTTITESGGVISSTGGGGGGSWPPLTPPLSADFTNTFGAVPPTFTDDPDIGFNLDGGPSVGGNFPAYAALALPAGDFSLRVKLAITFFLANFNNAGIALIESGTNKTELFGVGWTGGTQIKIDRLPLPSGFDGEPFNSPDVVGYRFFRVDRVGSTLNFYASADGKNWTLLYTESLTAYFVTAPDFIGLGVLYNNGSGAHTYVSCPWWVQDW